MKEINYDCLKVCTEVHYTGDMANLPGFGKIVKVHGNDFYPVLYDVKIDNGVEVKVWKNLTPVSFKPSVGRRFILKSEYDEERKKRLENLKSRMTNLKQSTQKTISSIEKEQLPLKSVKVKEPQYEQTTIGMKQVDRPSGQYKTIGSYYEEVVFESPITTNGSSHYPNSKNYFAHARGDEVVEGGVVKYTGKDRLTGKTFDMNEEIAKRPKYNKTGNKDFDAYSVQYYKDFDRKLKPQLLDSAKKTFNEKGVEVVDVDMSDSYKRGTPNPESDLDVKVYYKGNVNEDVLAERMETLWSDYRVHDVHIQKVEMTGGGKKIWREQEIQSDLLQKEGIEQFDVRGYADKSKLEIHEENLSKLQPFTNDRFGERIMRERIKEKASKGYSKYRFPTGETIGKIEGFENPSWMIESGSNRGKFLTVDNIKVGDEVMSGDVIQNNNQWIITDILGDGRFKAVPKRADRGLGFERWKKEFPNEFNRIKETFDLTGKSNPQYYRYRKWCKFLKNTFSAKEVVDPNGNSWYEVDLLTAVNI